MHVAMLRRSVGCSSRPEAGPSLRSGWQIWFGGFGFRL